MTLAVVLVLVAAAWLARRRSPAAARVPTGAPAVANVAPAPLAAATAADRAAVALPLPASPASVAWIVLGGSATPAQCHQSLHADALEAVATFGGPGAAFFGPGAGARVVASGALLPAADQLGDRPTGADANGAGRPATAAYDAAALWAELAEVPVATGFAAVAPAFAAADAASIERWIPAALVAEQAAPLLLAVLAHGSSGPSRREVEVPLWGGGALRPDWLADAAGRARRPLRVVVAACYGGGFAELAFAAADPSRGAAAADVCGVFAAPWDLESSGCVADPDRRSHDGYARHLLAALRGADAAAAALPGAPPPADLDGSGAIGLLDAHSWVRAQLTSADVPTTTSERWLRARLAAAGAAEDAVEFADGPGLADAPTPTQAAQERAAPWAVEERAVVATLAARMAVAAPWTQADAVLDERDALVQETAQTLREAQAEVTTHAAALRAIALARWPALEDPWRPDFGATWAAARSTLPALLRRSPAWPLWQQARTRRDAAQRLSERAVIARALAERLQRATRTHRLAAVMAERSLDDFAVFTRLRTCERWRPPLRSSASRGGPF